VFDYGDISLVLSHSIHLLVQSKVSLVQLKFETFDWLITLTIVTYYFNSGLSTCIEFVLGEDNLSSASGTTHSPNATNDIVKL